MFLRHRFQALLASAALAGSVLSAVGAKPNVLFIAVDDLRPELNCFGQSHIVSPNIDKLADRGMRFQRAYCMVPTCGASRASLMTGIRPAHNRFVNYLTWAERDAPGIPTLNTHLKRNGYHTVSLGKIFHHRTDSLEGWSEDPWRPAGGLDHQYQLEENRRIHKRNNEKQNRPDRGPPFEAGPNDDEAYPDGQIARKAIEQLESLSRSNDPFFLAVGFLKPHLPFNCPKKYWDLYERDSIRVPQNYHPPENAPNGAVHHFGELRAYHGIPNQGILGSETARTMIHGYYACVSYVDAQVGKLLDTLDRLELSGNTVVVLWGDHGWNLGEHTMWCKHSCFETSMHAPLIIAAPDYQPGLQTDALVEFIDVYPTLCELTGTSLPSHLQGSSLVPLMRNPNRPWKPAAIGRYRTGDTLRTADFRFTQYWQPDGTRLGRMLYDHRIDPGENTNIAGRAAGQADEEALFEMLKKQMGTPDNNQ